MTKPPKTRGAMDPPTRPFFLPLRIAMALIIALVIAAIYAIATWQAPTTGWLWPIAISTAVLTIALLVRDILAEAD